jgi:2-amino-4-hydroxy-6-hydroxymethyldihydropteridine diphosphokinase
VPASALPRRVLLGLGSNLGDRRALLRDAVYSLPELTAVSSAYETQPVGGPPGQPCFLNAVVALRSRLGPFELLRMAQALEARAGRERGLRWGPRTLDVDVLWIDGVRLCGPELVIPHPRMWERAFVLVPLREVASDLVREEAFLRAVGEVRWAGSL